MHHGRRGDIASVVFSFHAGRASQVARKTPQLSTLVAALESQQLAGGTLADRNAVQTVFAPTNDAFVKLEQALGITQAQLLANSVRHPQLFSFVLASSGLIRGSDGTWVYMPHTKNTGRITRGAEALNLVRCCSTQALLQTVLKYHIVAGKALKAADLSNNQKLTTIQGDNVTVQLSGGSVVIVGVSSRATVVIPDVAACKSVVHVIDTVLLPQGRDLQG